MDNTIYKDTERYYVTDLFEKMHQPQLLYHNLDHTKKVVEKTNEIAAHCHVGEKDMMILFIAAWFHDTGHLFTGTSKHEQESVKIMRTFMTDRAADGELITAIEGCILATKFPGRPSNLLEEIICDADTYHFGTDEFNESNKLVMEEHRLR